MQLRNSILSFTITLFTSLLLMSAMAQSASTDTDAAGNIRPVARLCLAGQPCVGAPAPSTAAQVEVEAPAAVQQQTAEPQSAAAQPAQESIAQPAPAAQADAETEEQFDPAAAWQQSCVACHASATAAALGAPAVGDQEAWDERLEKGMDAVMANVIDGINTMPPRGLCLDCTDEDLRAIVDYMLTL